MIGMIKENQGAKVVVGVAKRRNQNIDDILVTMIIFYRL